MSMRTLAAILVLGSTLSLGCDTEDESSDGNDASGDDGGDDGGDEDADSDGDGLTDAEEEELGLDPDSDDTDMDGFTDAEEVEAGTDGTLCYDVPEGWAQCAELAEEDGVNGRKYIQTATMPNWGATDQFGERVDAYQFYSQIIVLDLSAGWCGPCRTAAQSAEEEFQEFKEDGVVFIHHMIDDNSNDGKVTDDGFVADWAETYGLSFPVVYDDSVEGYGEAYYGFSQSGVIQGVPTFVVIDREMTIHDYWSGGSSVNLNRAVNELLDAD